MKKLISINPYTEEINGEFELSNIEDINKKIEIANKAFQKWKTTSKNEKKKLFLKLADLLEENIEECANLETSEMGMLNHISKAGLEKTTNLIRWFANNFENILLEKDFETTDGIKGRELYDPLGVIFGIAPWNFPFNQLLRAAVPNILAGNTQIYKHSSNVPMCALKIQELFDKAGFEEGVYTNIFVSSSLSEDIISNKHIAGINLTGSEKAGSSVGSLAGKYLKPSVLELGGNDAFVICKDSNLDKIIDFAVSGRIRNGGQGCNGSKRFIVLEKDYDEFCEKFTKKMKSLKIGNPMDQNTEIQPLSSKKAILEIEKQIENAVKTGAKITTGGKILNQKGFFIPPTVLINVDKNTSSYNEEIFGPVASVIKAKNIEESIKLANGTDFGLSACVFGNNQDEIMKIAKQLDGGMIFINNIAGSKASIPFGGIKKSGYGKENGPEGLKSFTNKKIILY